VLKPYGVLAGGKAVMKMLGVDCGPVRPPLGNLPQHAHMEVYERLKKLDIFPRPLSPPISG